jgi:hypothetical protein
MQGRAVLMSHQSKGKIYKGTGYWGDTDGYKAIEPGSLEGKHSWLERDGVGTTVHLLGWESPKDWINLVIGYAIANFFAAFARNSLVLRIGDKEITASSLQKFAASAETREAMRKEKSEDKLDDALAYLKCLEEGDQVIKETSQLNSLGRTSFRFCIFDSAPRKVALIRNDMLITDAIPGFWKRVPSRLSDFVGLVEILDKDGAQLIRSMEPPAHNALSKDWLSIAEDRRKGGVALDKLVEGVKKFLERHAGGHDEALGKVDFMADFFADEAGEDSSHRPGEEFNPNGKFTFTPKQLKLLPVTQVKFDDEQYVSEDDDEDYEIDGFAPSSEVDPNHVGEEGGGAGIRSGDEPIDSGGDKDGPGAGDGMNGEGGGDGMSSTDQGKKSLDGRHAEKELSLDNVRIVKVEENRVRVYLTSSASISASLRINEIGADIALPFEIVDADIGSVEEGVLLIKLKRNERACISVTLSRPIVGGLKLIASTRG